MQSAGFTWDGMIHKITPKQWDAMLAVHCTAPFRLIQVPLCFWITSATYLAVFHLHTSLPCRLFSQPLSTAANTTQKCAQAAAPVMRDAAKKELEEFDQAKQRCIINVSSTSGTHGNAGQANYSTVSHLACVLNHRPEPILSVCCTSSQDELSGKLSEARPVRQTSYVQAKAGVVGLSKTVAREWGTFNIRCNAIAYGFIATRLTASKDDGASISVNGEKVMRNTHFPCDASAGAQVWGKDNAVIKQSGMSDPRAPAHLKIKRHITPDMRQASSITCRSS